MCAEKKKGDEGGKSVECVVAHLLQVLLEHLHHGLQLGHFPLQSYVALTVSIKYRQFVSLPQS